MLKCRITYIAILTVTFFFYIFYADYLSFLAMLFVLILPVLLFLLTLVASRKLSLLLTAADSSVMHGQPASISLQIKNNSYLPLSRMKIYITLENQLIHDKQEISLWVPVPERRRHTISWSFTSKYCGCVKVRVKKIVILDYFGLFSFSKEIQQSVGISFLPVVYPIVSTLDSHSNFQMDSDLYSTTKPGDDPSETFDIREYCAGDRPRAIHWKLSSKMDQLLIREFSLPINSAYFILIELLENYQQERYSPLVIDAILSGALSLSESLIQQQRQHHIAWFDTADNTLIQSEIKSLDDLSTVVKKILTCTCYQKQANALKYHSIVNAQHSYSHFIYLTPCIKTSELFHLADQKKQQHATVIHISELQELSSSDQETKRLLTASGITTVSATPETLNACLDQLLI